MELLGTVLVLAMILSPVLGTVGSLIFVAVVSRRLQLGIAKNLGDFFFRYMVPWGMAGFGLAFVIVVVLTVSTGSPQAPLALFVYGPAGIGLGIVFGAHRWFRSASKPNQACGADAGDSAALRGSGG